MNFYEIKDPYLALIAAEDEKQCLKLYKDIVCGVVLLIDGNLL